MNPIRGVLRPARRMERKSIACDGSPNRRGRQCNFNRGVRAGGRVDLGKVNRVGVVIGQRERTRVRLAHQLGRVASFLVMMMVTVVVTIVVRMSADVNVRTSLVAGRLITAVRMVKRDGRLGQQQTWHQQQGHDLSTHILLFGPANFPTLSTLTITTAKARREVAPCLTVVGTITVTLCC